MSLKNHSESAWEAMKEVCEIISKYPIECTNKQTVIKATEALRLANPEKPEWTLTEADDGLVQVYFQGLKVTYRMPMSRAVTTVNALNSFQRLLNVCSQATCLLDHIESKGVAIDAWRVTVLRGHVHKAIDLATMYDEHGRLKDG